MTKELIEYPIYESLISAIPADTYQLSNRAQIGALQLFCDSHSVTADRILRCYYDSICNCLMAQFSFSAIGIEVDGYVHS